MSVRAYFDVWCDVDGERCVGWCEGATASGRKARSEARRNARALGWTTKRVGGKTLDVCPNCKENR